MQHYTEVSHFITVVRSYTEYTLFCRGIQYYTEISRVMLVYANVSLCNIFVCCLVAYVGEQFSPASLHQRSIERMDTQRRTEVPSDHVDQAGLSGPDPGRQKCIPKGKNYSG